MDSNMAFSVKAIILDLTGVTWDAQEISNKATFFLTC